MSPYSKANASPLARNAHFSDPDQKFEELQNLGSRLKLPEGWTFHSPVLEQDLVFMTVNGETQITQDDLGNTYDWIDGSYSNFKP